MAQDTNKVYEFILGDCLKESKKIPDDSISLIITSPPYNIGIKYHKYKDKKPKEQYLEWIYDIFVECKRILRDDGHIFLNVGYTNIDPWISMEIALKLKGLFKLQNNITWVKSISIGENSEDTYGHFKPINSARFITPTNEQIYHFTKYGNVKMDRLAIGVPYKWKCNRKKRNPKKIIVIRKKVKELNLPFDREGAKKVIEDRNAEWLETYDEYYDQLEENEKTKATNTLKSDKRCKGNTWFIPYKTINSKSHKGYHPATYPEDLVEHCIKVSGVKTGSVLDPFVGSGTTIRVVKKLNEKYDCYNLTGIGIDIDEKYIQYCDKTI